MGGPHGCLVGGVCKIFSLKGLGKDAVQGGLKPAMATKARLSRRKPKEEVTHRAMRADGTCADIHHRQPRTASQ